MPIYLYNCNDDHETEDYSKVDERREFVRCEECGKRAKRVIAKATIFGFDGDYEEENLEDPREPGKRFVVTSRAHKQQRMKDLSLEELPPSYTSKHKRKTGTLTFDGGHK